MAFDVFISYPHQDKPAADAACAALESAGVRCWIAPRDVVPGEDWAASIVEAIEQCRAMVLIFSASANASRQIQREVQQAFDRNIPVIPLRVENVAPAKALAYYMGPVHWLDALTPPLEHHLSRLTHHITALLQIDRSDRKVATEPPDTQSRPARGRDSVERPVHVPAERQHPEQGREARAAVLAAPPRSRRAVLAGAGVLGATAAGVGLWTVSRQGAKPIRTFEGHTDTVNSVAILPDGRAGLSASGDQTLQLWDLATGSPLRLFRGHRGRVYSVAIAPDGRSALSGSEDTTLKLWDIASGRELRTFDGGHAGGVGSVAIAPDGRTALSGGVDFAVKQWDVPSGRLQLTFRGHTDIVYAVAVAPDGRTALSASQDKTIKMWDYASGRLLRTIEAHAYAALSLAIAPDGRTALSGGGDNTLKQWDLASGRELRTLKGHTNVVYSIVTPNGRTALSASADKTLRLWDMTTGLEGRVFEGHADGVKSVAIAPDGRTALSGSFDKTLKLWDLT